MIPGQKKSAQTAGTVKGANNNIYHINFRTTDMESQGFSTKRPQAVEMRRLRYAPLYHCPPNVMRAIRLAYRDMEPQEETEVWI